MFDEFENEYSQATIDEANRQIAEIEEQERQAKAEQEKRANAQQGWKSDPYSAWQGLQEAAIRRLYKDDPLVREGIDVQIMLDRARVAPHERKSVVQYDENGNLLPPKKGLSTSHEQLEYMRAIRKSQGLG